MELNKYNYFVYLSVIFISVLYIPTAVACLKLCGHYKTHYNNQPFPQKKLILASDYQHYEHIKKYMPNQPNIYPINQNIYSNQDKNLFLENLSKIINVDKKSSSRYPNQDINIISEILSKIITKYTSNIKTGSSNQNQKSTYSNFDINLFLENLTKIINAYTKSNVDKGSSKQYPNSIYSNQDKIFISEILSKINKYKSYNKNGSFNPDQKSTYSNFDINLFLENLSKIIYKKYKSNVKNGSSNQDHKSTYSNQGTNFISEILSKIKNQVKTSIKKELIPVIKDIFQNKCQTNSPATTSVTSKYNCATKKTSKTIESANNGPPACTTCQYQPISKGTKYIYNIKNYVNHHHHHYYDKQNTEKGNGDSIDVVTPKPGKGNGTSFNNDELKPKKDDKWINGVKLSR